MNYWTCLVNILAISFIDLGDVPITLLMPWSIVVPLAGEILVRNGRVHPLRRERDVVAAVPHSEKSLPLTADLRLGLVVLQNLTMSIYHFWTFRRRRIFT